METQRADAESPPQQVQCVPAPQFSHPLPQLPPPCEAVNPLILPPQPVSEPCGWCAVASAGAYGNDDGLWRQYHRRRKKAERMGLTALRDGDGAAPLTTQLPRALPPGQ